MFSWELIELHQLLPPQLLSPALVLPPEEQSPSSKPGPKALQKGLPDTPAAGAAGETASGSGSRREACAARGAMAVSAAAAPGGVSAGGRDELDEEACGAAGSAERASTAAAVPTSAGGG